MRMLLQIIAVLSFALAGGSFTHGDELGATHQHIATDQASSSQHPHIAVPASAHSDAQASIHCGAQILLLIYTHNLEPIIAGAVFEQKPADAAPQHLTFCDLPPPRT